MEEKGRERADFRFSPHRSESPRKKHFPDTEYEENPFPYIGNREDITFCVQPMLAGGSYTTAWKYCHDHNKKYLIISVGYSLETEDSFREAEDHICKIVGTGLENRKMRHSLWWQEYDNKSFLTIPDKAIEKFYWIQMYKIASASPRVRTVRLSIPAVPG